MQGVSKSISGFDPRSIVGCSLWLDAADAGSITGTTTVTKWSDKSGSGNNFTTTAGTVSTTTDSGYTVVNFPSGAIMTSSQQITFTPASAFYVVFRLTTMNGQGLSMVLSFPNATVGQTGDCSIRLGTTGLVGSGTITGGVQDVGNNNYYVNGNFNPSYPLSTYSNSFAMVGTTVCSSTTTSYIALSSSFSARYFIGNICEVLYYPAGLTTTQRQSVEGYLAWKWGIKSSLPAAHPFYYLPSFSRVFGPLDIPGCALWLDGADASTIAGTTTVTKWSDKSGSGNNFTPSAGTVSTSTDSGYSVLNFPSGAIMSSANQITFTPASAFYVLFRLTAMNGQGLSMVLSFPNATVGQTGDCSIRLTTTGLVGSGSITGGVQDVGNSNYYVNGTFNPSYPLSTYSNSFAMIGTTVCSSTTTSYIALSSSFSSRFFIGNMCELLYYPGGLTTTQRQQVEGYLATKWGLQSNLPGATFSPLTVSGCALWLDGADASTMNSTTTVTSWTDKSGLGNTMAGTATVSGSNMTFNGSTQAFSNTTFVFPSSNYSMFAVYSNTTAPASTAYMNVVYGSGGYPMLGVYGSSKFVSARSVVANTGALSPNVAASSTVLVSATYTPSTFSPFINGSAETTLAGTTLAATGIYVGGPSNYFNGSISEILIYSSNLSTAQRQSVENYLMRKWGISNITTHPFKSIPPSTSQPPQFQEVTPGNWTYDWQPYLSNLTRANNSANSTVIPTLAYGTNSLSPALSTQHYIGGVLAPNGTIYGIPFLSSNILMINTATNGVSYGTGGASLSPALSTQVYYGGVLAPNGNIYCIPYLSSNILIINTSTNSVSYGTGGASLSPALSTQGYYGGVLAPNGTIYGIPFAAANILIINTSTNSVSYGTGGVSLSPALSTQGYYGGVLAPNGNIYCIPSASSNILIINTSTNSVSYGTGGPSLSPALSTQGYYGGVLAPNGTIYGIPLAAANILIINTSTNSVSYGTGGASLSPALSTQGYRGGVLAPNGNIYCIPSASSNILIINTSTNSVSYGTNSLSPALSTQGYYGGVLAPNGTIYGIPYSASNILRISNTYTETPSSNYCLSPWTNKL